MYSFNIAEIGLYSRRYNLRVTADDDTSGAFSVEALNGREECVCEGDDHNCWDRHSDCDDGDKDDDGECPEDCEGHAEPCGSGDAEDSCCWARAYINDPESLDSMMADFFSDCLRNADLVERALRRRYDEPTPPAPPLPRPTTSHPYATIGILKPLLEDCATEVDNPRLFMRIQDALASLE